ncbi:MAG: sulfatase [Verrucomicrobiae bacterium]|jgi:arylsulfatase A-like enzyme|nr:sulfatase [Verrucomicrobiae bacterium]
MLRTSCLMKSLLTSLLFLCALSLPPNASAARPNILFILVDDLGYMDIGANNPDTFYETPNIDRLAAEGMRFTDGYAANPVCSPTRYSIMTGKYPSRVDATNFFSGTRGGRFKSAPLHDDMPLAEITLAEALKRGGYHTFFAGKWHLGPTEEFWPEHQGFDVNKGGWKHGGPWGGGKYFSPYANPRLEDGPKGEHLPIRLANETMRFIEEHKDGPFLAYLSFYSVHTPLLTRPDLRKKYEEKAKRLGLIGKEEFADEEQVWPDAKARQVRILQKHSVYAGMMETMDTAVGMVLGKLKSLGLDEKTVVCFMSDNGGLSTSEGSPTSNLPLRGGKGWIYEGGIREPYLIKWPGVTKPGSVSSAPVCSIDFYPTLVEIAGIKIDHAIDGVSLVPTLKSGEVPGRDALYWHYPHYSNQGGFPGGAIRMGDWKLVERYEDGRAHLYNLKTDLGEKNDLSKQNAERVRQMRARLHAWYRDVDAKFLQAKDGESPWQPERQ